MPCAVQHSSFVRRPGRGIRGRSHFPALGPRRQRRQHLAVERILAQLGTSPPLDRIPTSDTKARFPDLYDGLPGRACTHRHRPALTRPPQRPEGDRPRPARSLPVTPPPSCGARQQACRDASRHFDAPCELTPVSDSHHCAEEKIAIDFLARRARSGTGSSRSRPSKAPTDMPTPPLPHPWRSFQRLWSITTAPPDAGAPSPTGRITPTEPAHIRTRAAVSPDCGHRPCRYCGHRCWRARFQNGNSSGLPASGWARWPTSTNPRSIFPGVRASLQACRPRVAADPIGGADEGLEPVPDLVVHGLQVEIARPAA